MTSIDVAAQVYALCADTIRREIAHAEENMARSDDVGLPWSTAAREKYVIGRLKPILEKFDTLAGMRSVS
jgi:hypothetical protein